MADAERPREPARRRSGDRDRRARTVFSLSEHETHDFGRAFAQQLRGGELVLLEGELGAGKTVFVRGLAEGLEVAPEEVSSPTYTLIHEYRGGRLSLVHVDLYRLDDPDQVETLGLEEFLGAGGVVVVEWGERLPIYRAEGAIRVKLYDIGEGSRRIEVHPDDHDGMPGDA